MKRTGVVVLTMLFFFIGSSQIIRSETIEREYWERITNPNLSISLINWQLTLNPGASDKYVDKHIVGAVKNDSKKEFSEIKIEFAIYDENGFEIAIVSSHHDQLKPGGIWKFEIPVTADVEKAEAKGLYVPAQELKAVKN